MTMSQLFNKLISFLYILFFQLYIKKLYKRYNLSDIQKAVIELLQDNSPMSSTEISKKIRTNRITISKYLDILYFQKIINKKKIGSVNFWFLEPGIININSKDVSYIDL